MVRPGGKLEIITANRLDTGAVVWFGGEAGWVDRVGEAAVLAPGGHALADAKASERANMVVDVAMIEAMLEDGRPVPVGLRERIRALGPTVRPDLGYQAEY
ncbi:MAG: DUF2849 domain-containing protein [Rhodospirillaceae bacterium]